MAMRVLLLPCGTFLLLATATLEGSIGNKINHETELVYLNLNGGWEGEWYNSLNEPSVISITFTGQHFDQGSVVLLEGKIVDEGGGYFKMTDGVYDLLGIYQQKGDILMMCFCDADDGRPTTFRPGRGKTVLFLKKAHRHQGR